MIILYRMYIKHVHTWEMKFTIMSYIVALWMYGDMIAFIFIFIFLFPKYGLVCSLCAGVWSDQGLLLYMHKSLCRCQNVTWSKNEPHIVYNMNIKLLDIGWPIFYSAPTPALSGRMIYYISEYYCLPNQWDLFAAPANICTTSFCAVRLEKHCCSHLKGNTLLLAITSDQSLRSDSVRYRISKEEEDVLHLKLLLFLFWLLPWHISTTIY